VKPSEFNFERTDFESKKDVIEHFLKGEIAAKLLVLEKFRAGDSSVIRQDVKDAADLLWMLYENTPRALERRKRRKMRSKKDNVTELKLERKARMACAC